MLVDDQRTRSTDSRVCFALCSVVERTPRALFDVPEMRQSRHSAPYVGQELVPVAAAVVVADTFVGIVSAG